MLSRQGHADEAQVGPRRKSGNQSARRRSSRRSVGRRRAARSAALLRNPEFFFDQAAGRTGG